MGLRHGMFRGTVVGSRSESNGNVSHFAGLKCQEIWLVAHFRIKLKLEATKTWKSVDTVNSVGYHVGPEDVAHL